MLLPGLAALALVGGFSALGEGAARQLGIVPRTWGGLPGIVFGCFVHFSWHHCGWNALALLLLGPCVLSAAPAGESFGVRGSSRGAGGVTRFVAASAFISVTSGFCVWCLARPALHAGASGIVCGYAGLLLALLLRRRDVPLGSLLMVLSVVACYGSTLLLHRPSSHGRLLLYEACTSQTSSAEHHTFGFLSGLASTIFFCQGGGAAEPLKRAPAREPGGGEQRAE